MTSSPRLREWRKKPERLETISTAAWGRFASMSQMMVSMVLYRKWGLI